MADQQFPVLPPAHHDPHMGIVRVEGQVSGLRVRLGNRRAVGALGGGTAATAQDVFAARDVVENPIHHAGAIQAVGAVGAGGGTARGGHFPERPPPAVPANDQGFSAPKISHLPNQGKRGLHRLLPGLVQVSGQGADHLQQIGAGDGEAPGQGGQGRLVGQKFRQGAVLFIRESVDGPHFIGGLRGNGDMQDGFCPPLTVLAARMVYGLYFRCDLRHVPKYGFQTVHPVLVQRGHIHACVLPSRMDGEHSQDLGPVRPLTVDHNIVVPPRLQRLQLGVVFHIDRGNRL